MPQSTIGFVAAHVNHPRRGSKQHAQLRDDQPKRRPLWVYDADDWENMTSLPSGSLVCPEPSCRSPFAVPIQNAWGTRFLRDLPGSSCAHTWARPDLGGGPMSPQHRWLQARIARICDLVGHSAITEHYETDADVFIPDAKFVIEVQRWSTEFELRTVARENKGMHVLWLLTEDAKGRAVNRALFRVPAARIRVHARGDRERRLTPWLHVEENAEAVLSVFATVAYFDWCTMTLKTRHHDGAQFLAEILSGQRRWYPPGRTSLPSAGCGAWAIAEDLIRARTAAWVALAKQALRPHAAEEVAVQPTSGLSIPALAESSMSDFAPAPVVDTPAAGPTTTVLDVDAANERAAEGAVAPRPQPVVGRQGTQPLAPPVDATRRSAPAAAPRQRWWRRLLPLRKQ